MEGIPLRAFTDSLHQLSEYEDIMRAMQMGKGLVTITGCIDAQKPHMIYTLGNNRKEM